MNLTLEAARRACPKHMLSGPCGGVTPAGMCEADATLPCPYLAVLDALPWRAPQIAAERPPQRSAGRLEATLRSGGFALVAEAYSADSADLSELVAQYAALAPQITAVNIAENALATPHAATLALAALLERAGVETIVNMTCRDRNRIGLQSELLGVAALGITNVFCITGDHPALGDQPDAAPVFDLDSFGLIRLARRLCDAGALLGGRPLAVRPRLFVGGAANPFTPPVALQAERVAAKVAAGADFIQTQAVFDIARFRLFVDQLAALGALERAWLVAGVAVVTTLEQALWLREAVPGARVPQALITLLERTPPAQRRAAGLAAAAERIAALRATPGVSGALLFPLHGDVAALGEVLALLAG